ncbi:MAG: helix-turn-helix transcriptional regulator [Eubacteriaceae bacterium]
MKNNIRKLREDKQITQLELAYLAGVSRQAIIAIENNKYDPSIRLAFKFSHIFGKSIEELFCEEVEK